MALTRVLSALKPLSLLAKYLEGKNLSNPVAWTEESITLWLELKGSCSFYPCLATQKVQEIQEWPNILKKD